MPITAKFSQTLYDRLGHPVADELVDWFNQVDAAYRSEIREFHDQGAGRFDATLRVGLSEFGRGIDRRFAEAAQVMDQRFAEVDRVMNERFAKADRVMDQRFAEVDRVMNERFAKAAQVMDQRFAESQRVMDQRFGEMNIKLEALRWDLRTDFRDHLIVQLRWMIGMWGAVLVAVIGLWVRR